MTHTVTHSLGCLCRSIAKMTHTITRSLDESNKITHVIIQHLEDSFGHTKVWD